MPFCLSARGLATRLKRALQRLWPDWMQDKKGALLAKGTSGWFKVKKVYLGLLGIGLRRGVVLFLVNVARRLVLFLIDLFLLTGGQRAAIGRRSHRAP